MKVYLVVDSCPPDFAEPRVISVHLTLKGAREKVKKLKDKDDYVYQYLDVESKKVEN